MRPDQNGQRLFSVHRERALNIIGVVAMFALALIAVSASPVATNAQDYPSRPIRIIVGYPPGAGIDYTARLFADWLKTALGSPRSSKPVRRRRCNSRRIRFRLTRTVTR